MSIALHRSRRPRILMVCAQVPPVYGGAGQQAFALSQRLADRGFGVTLLTLNQATARSRETWSGLTIRRVGRAPRPGRFSGWEQAASLGLYAFGQSAFGSYELVHFHGSYWWTVCGSIGARLRRRPTVVKVTRLGEDDPTTTASKRARGLPLGRLYGAPQRNASAVVALSQEIMSSCRAVGIEPVMIPNGVDTDRFVPPSPSQRIECRTLLDLPQKGAHVLHSGYLAEHKGVLTLIKAWASARENLPDGSTLMLAGPVDGFYRELNPEFEHKLRRAADEAGSVCFLGKVAESEMETVYRAASIFCLLSDAEGMPNSLLEALACGLPVVATDIPGVREVIGNESFARLVNRRDSAVAAEAIVRLAGAGEAQLRVLRAAARSRAVEYALNATTEAYVNLYGTLLNENSRLGRRRQPA